MQTWTAPIQCDEYPSRGYEPQSERTGRDRKTSKVFQNGVHDWLDQFPALRINSCWVGKDLGVVMFH